MTNVVGRFDVEQAEKLFGLWLDRFASVLESGEVFRLPELFLSDGYWRDVLSFTWRFRTFRGLEAIGAMLGARLSEVAIHDIRAADGVVGPRFIDRFGCSVLEGFFDFTTRVGRGRGLVQLRLGPGEADEPRAWVVLTTLQSLAGPDVQHDERVTQESARIESVSWLDRRRSESAYSDRDPQVLVLGAGQGGLTLGARLRQMGVDTLIIEKNARVGDNWRARYQALKLHNPASANHMPYMGFPSTWPKYLPKDMVANWLEAYSMAMELNVWTETALEEAQYDATLGRWQVTVRQADGTVRHLRPVHLVLATGSVSSVPYVPSLRGLNAFSGAVMHSSRFRRGADFAGKRALVVGSGNSGHDVAQAMYLGGAESVTMMQRGSTTVVSLEPAASSMFAIYEDEGVEFVDLLVAARPFELFKLGCQQFTSKAIELDRNLISRLNDAGFKTDYGEDSTGFLMKYSTTGGGYYINVGCSELIADGSIGLIDAGSMDTFEADGLRLRDGKLLAFDVVVLATGYENQERDIENVLGREVADRVGPVWGFDDHGFLRNMWSPTGQEHLWLMGGALTDARLYSRFLALQLAASLWGYTPASPE